MIVERMAVSKRLVLDSSATDARFRDTRARILNAARQEIVAHGVSGARINRIAEAAGTSKERIYSYFRSKTDLVEAVARERMLLMQQAVPFDAYNLVGYVGALVDFLEAHPDDVRLSHWFALERDADTGKDPIAGSLKDRTIAVGKAQTQGFVDVTWEPLTLLNLLMGIAMAWATAPLFVHRLDAGEQAPAATRRAAAEEAARRLVQWGFNVS